MHVEKSLGKRLNIEPLPQQLEDTFVDIVGSEQSDRYLRRLCERSHIFGQYMNGA